MTQGISYFFKCKVRIDKRDRHLRSCMTCNIWWSLTGGGVVELSVEDIQALQQLRRSK